VHVIIDRGGVSTFHLVLAAVFVAGTVAIWIKTGKSEPPKTGRGRLWEFCWRSALLGICILVIGSFWPRWGLGPGGWILVVPLVIGLLVVLLRRQATWLIGAALIPLGFYGFVIARDGGFWTSQSVAVSPAQVVTAVPPALPLANAFAARVQAARSAAVAAQAKLRSATVTVHAATRSVAVMPISSPARAAAAAVPHRPLIVWLLTHKAHIQLGSPDTTAAITQYGPLHFGDYSMQYYLVLPLAYAMLLLGGWLFWRGLNYRSPITRLVLGPFAAASTRAQLYGLLLFPVVFVGAALFKPNLWFGAGVAAALFTLALLGGAALLVRKTPSRAAGIATGGLILLGVIGLFVTSTWGYRWGLAETPNQYVLDGVVAVSSQAMANAARVQGIFFIALGLWLVPRTIPQARQLLGWASEGELLKRIQRLTESRAVAVDTAAADLRRLERDLHDGAQARLVALGMNLRAVERLIPTSPEAALALVAEARETSARALMELRELVRGVHPPVLADRGLADAIRALALDTPMSVETEVDLPGRPAAPIETACYFAVAEVLTNAVKHSGARDARVAVSHADGLLRISITDFGVGGADPARGTGLAGVEKRLATFDGILAVSSPVGGPTIVVMEVPCALSSEKISSS
jgi:signal transduction histidine kinase